MEEQETQEEGPTPKFKYNVDMGGNRGTTVMKFTEEEAEKRGLSGDDKVDGQEILPAEQDEPEEVEETPVTGSKAKTAANKRKTASDK